MMDLALRQEMVQTKVMMNRKGSSSCKSTIPEGICQMLRIAPGDMLDWNFYIENGEIVATVKKVKSK